MTGPITRYLPQSVRGSTAETNPPIPTDDRTLRERETTVSDAITSIFTSSLPSNYSSSVGGPLYVEQFRALADELARIQTTVLDCYEDTASWDLTRAPVLYQFLGNLVFPDGTIPDISGDTTYRTLLNRLVQYLLSGASHASVENGLKALSEGLHTVAHSEFLGVPGIGWDYKSRNVTDIFASGNRGTTRAYGMGLAAHTHEIDVDDAGNGTTTRVFYDETGPDHTHTITGFVIESAFADGIVPHTHDILSAPAQNPVTLEANARLIARVLSAGETLFTYTNLLREVIPPPTLNLVAENISVPHYEDARWQYNQLGFVDTSGRLLDRGTLLTTSDFRGARPGLALRILSGSHNPECRVTEFFGFPQPTDSTARSYTTSLSGLSGHATVMGGVVIDPEQDWSALLPGDTITFSAGPNTGTYNVDRPTRDGIVVRPGGIRFEPHTNLTGTINVSVEVNRLGRQSITTRTDDVSSWFHDTGNTIVIPITPVVNGSGQPATARDITVSYDGVTHPTVESLNPYTGVVVLSAPITGFSGTTHTVTVTYKTAAGRRFGMVLNHPGLTLGQGFSAPLGITRSTGPTQRGAVRTGARFEVVVERSVEPRPDIYLTSPRFSGYQTRHSALIGSPTTLRIGTPPGQVLYPSEFITPREGALSYVGGDAIDPNVWETFGEPLTIRENGYLQTTVRGVGLFQGTLTTEPGGIVYLGARLRVVSVSPDGIYTGAGLGFYARGYLYYAGALIVPNPVTHTSLRHLGVLRVGTDPRDAGSWSIGPNAIGTPLTRNTIAFNRAELPVTLRVGAKFQCISGTQAGTYTVTALGTRGRSETVATITPALPSDPELYGAGSLEALFETPWDEEVASWRIVADTGSRTTKLIYGGAAGGVVVTGSASTASVGIDLPASENGSAIWGSISRAVDVSVNWYTVRALSYLPPSGLTGTLTQADWDFGPDTDWYASSAYGWERTTSGTRTLHAEGTTYGYGLVDPLLKGRTNSLFESTFGATYDTGGNGPSVILRRGRRRARVAAITYVRSGGQHINILPVETLHGRSDYGDQGWVTTTDTGYVAPTATARGTFLEMTSPTTGRWEISRGTAVTLTDPVRARFRLSFRSFTAGSGNRLGLYIATHMFGRGVVVGWITDGLVTLAGYPEGTILASTSMPVIAGEEHKYELYAHGSDVELWIDGTLRLTVAQSEFPLSTPGSKDIAVYGCTNGAFIAFIASVTYGRTGESDPNIHRTLGVLVGTDPTNINHWIVPRSDGYPVANSHPSASIVEWDWSTSTIRFRIVWDAVVGIALFRPDLDPPPGYVDNWTSETLDVGASWIHVENQRLPQVEGDTEYGDAFFGCLDSVSTATWSDIRYRSYTVRAPTRATVQGSILGRSHTGSSGDLSTVRRPILRRVTPRTTTEVYLTSLGVNADRVFYVEVGGMTLPRNGWSFDPSESKITLRVPLTDISVPVRVSFVLGGAPTPSALRAVPLAEGATILHDRTPPFFTRSVGRDNTRIRSASGGDNPVYPPDAGPGDPGYFLDDPYIARNPIPGATTYALVTRADVDNGGRQGALAGANDSFHAIAFSGSGFSERFGSPASDTLAPPMILGFGALGSSGLFGAPPTPAFTVGDRVSIDFRLTLTDNTNAATDSASYTLTPLPSYYRLGPTSSVYTLGGIILTGGDALPSGDSPTTGTL